MAKSEKLTTPVFRGCFTNSVFSAQSYGDGDPKFGITALWTPAGFGPNDKVRWKKLIAALDAESKKAFKMGWKDLPANYRKGIRDGLEKPELEGFVKGTRFASLTTKNPPGVAKYMGSGQPDIAIHPEHGNQDEVYSGAYYQATVNVFSFNNKGKGVALGLQNIRKVRDGERLDGRRNATEDFEDGEIDDSWLDQLDEDTGIDVDEGSEDLDDL